MGTRNKGRKEEDELRARALAAETKANEAMLAASKPGEFEERRRKRVLDLDKWEAGELGPIDVRNMPGAGVAMDLYTQAKRTSDAGRIGRGLGTLSDDVNPNFAAALDKEMQLERDLAASGMLEDYVGDTLAAKNAELYGLTEMGNARRMAIAGMQSNAYENAENRRLNYLTRPKPMGFLKQLVLAGWGSASQAGRAAGAGM